VLIACPVLLELTGSPRIEPTRLGQGSDATATMMIASTTIPPITHSQIHRSVSWANDGDGRRARRIGRGGVPGCKACVSSSMPAPHGDSGSSAGSDRSSLRDTDGSVPERGRPGPGPSSPGLIDRFSPRLTSRTVVPASMAPWMALPRIIVTLADRLERASGPRPTAVKHRPHHRSSLLRIDVSGPRQIQLLTGAAHCPQAALASYSMPMCRQATVHSSCWPTWTAPTG
jgi:hypothetical protein